MSVVYRLAPEHPFPAAVEDAYAAVEWVAANPDVIGSTGEVPVAGDSVGGTFAAVTSLMAAERDGPEIKYQALLYPAVGVEAGQASMQQLEVAQDIDADAIILPVHERDCIGSYWEV